MTLIIATIQQAAILITSDGRSTLIRDGVVAGIDDHYQKLMPMPDHSLVFANFGENLLDGKPARIFLADFMRQLNAGNFNIEQVADELRAYAHPAIRQRLRALGHPANICGFWIAGFSLKQAEPRLVEMTWRLKDEVISTEERSYGPIAVLIAGDGQKLVPPPDWHVVEHKTIKEVAAHHHSLMEQALHANVEHNSVGGDIQEVLIRREGWTWRSQVHPTTAGRTQPADGPSTRPSISPG